ncbi:MAG: DnaJ domain-containing protein [Spirochaetales bacterium]|nr:DnaJ domain-containing protein [Spirochaetales bacterium]
MLHYILIIKTKAYFRYIVRQYKPVRQDDIVLCSWYIFFVDYDLSLLEISTNTALKAAVVKKAYREMLKKYHPDFHKNDLEYTEKIIAINDAYRRLLKRLGQGSGVKHKQAAVSEVMGTQGLVKYKDQAYAFYKQGFTHFDKITSAGDPKKGLKVAWAEMSVKAKDIPRQVERESEEIAEIISKQLFHAGRAIYYFSIVRNEYDESEWAYDAHRKIIHIKKYLEKNLTMMKEFLEHRGYKV